MKNLAEIKNSSFRRLKTVAFWYQHHARYEIVENAVVYWRGYGSSLEPKAIKELFEGVRVKFEFAETLLFKDTPFRKSLEE